VPPGGRAGEPPGPAGADTGFRAADRLCENGRDCTSRAMKRWIPFLLVAALSAWSPAAHSSGRAGSRPVFSCSTSGRSPGSGAEERPWTRYYPGPAGGSPRRLYCDPSSPGARLTSAHGLVEAGKDDPRLRRWGSFARHRFRGRAGVPGMRALRVDRRTSTKSARRSKRRAHLGCPPPGADGVPEAGARPSRGRGDGSADRRRRLSYSSGPVLLASIAWDPRARRLRCCRRLRRLWRWCAS